MEFPNKTGHKIKQLFYIYYYLSFLFYSQTPHLLDFLKSKLIDGYVVTVASVHDSQPLDELLSEDDREQDFHSASTYTDDI